MLNARTLESLLRAGSVSAVAGVPALEKQVSDLFAALRRPVYRYLVALLDDHTEAEDLAQEVFLRLFCELRKGKAIENIRAWVFRVAHNLAVDRTRRKQQADLYARGELGRLEQETTPETAESGYLGREQTTRLKAALGRLSPQERQCIELRAEGLRYREIAEVLGVRIPTVQTALARAMKKIGDPA